ncbi:MAG TPA: carboxypeptidase-like regulatory domain-containing protein, partial [Vicinamibacterales bacterium]
LMGVTRLPIATTDSAGAFTFKNLPAGGYSLSVDKATYQPGRYPETSSRTMRTMGGKPVILRDGEAADTITIPLFHGGAITGRILDAYGDPIDSADVRVLRVTGGKPQMRGGGGSNDVGEFRVGRLEPGSYLLLAQSRRGNFDDPMTPQPVDVPAQPVPTYYPGVTALDLAQPIRVERGQTVGNIEITLAEAVPSVVTGTVLAEDGQPLKTGGFLMVRSFNKELNAPLDNSGAQVRPDGTFRLTLAPGEYVIDARANNTGNSDGPSGERSGMTRITVAGNMDGVTVSIGRLASASGKVVFEGTAPVPPNPQQMQFQLFGNADGFNCRQGRMRIAPDWTFTVEGLAGTCARPNVTGFGGWMLKSVEINGREFEEDSITFETGQQLRNVQVTLTDRRTGATFNVSDDSGQATREYVGLIFQVAKGQVVQGSIRTVVPPTDEMLAMAIAMNPARQANIQQQVSRMHSVPNLRPGEYYAIAIDDIAVEDAQDTTMMARLIPAATRITIGEALDTVIAVRRQTLADILKR